MVTDNDSTTRLYKHFDGYPSHTLDVIYHAMTDAKSISADVLVAKLIGHGTSDGSDIRVEQEFKGRFKLSQLGQQSDVEYIYVIDTHKKTIALYMGEWIDANSAGAKEIKKVKALMAKIKALGFKFVLKENGEEITAGSRFLKRIERLCGSSMHNFDVASKKDIQRLRRSLQT